MVEELAQHLPELAGSCMAVKGLKYKREWEVWGKREGQLQSGDEWAFEVRKPHAGLILVGGELGPIEASVIFGGDDFVREKLKKKAGKLGGYLRTLVSVPKQAAKAYHAERHAFRVLKSTARQRAQYFLNVFAPELTEEAATIVDEAVKAAELELLGWNSEEADQAWVQACLSFDHGGHDMQP